MKIWQSTLRDMTKIWQSRVWYFIFSN